LLAPTGALAYKEKSFPSLQSHGKSGGHPRMFRSSGRGPKPKLNLAQLRALEHKGQHRGNKQAEDRLMPKAFRYAEQAWLRYVGTGLRRPATFETDPQKECRRWRNGPGSHHIFITFATPAFSFSGTGFCRAQLAKKTGCAQRRLSRHCRERPFGHDCLHAGANGNPACRQAFPESEKSFRYWNH